MMTPMVRKLKELRAGGTQRFVFAWERDNGRAFRFELPVGESIDAETIRFAERTVKFVLWAAGGWRLHVCGPDAVCAAMAEAYRPGGPRDFDRDMMRKAYGVDIEVVRHADAGDVPETADSTRGNEVASRGCRIGFDLGASDFKIAAVQDGEVKFSDEFPWDPRNADDPSYHFEKLNGGLEIAARHLPRVDSIGGSTAGIVVDGQIRVASLLRAIPAGNYEKAQRLFRDIQAKWNVPVKVENDGDVTALAAYLTDGVKPVLGVAMGSSEAVGYLDSSGAVTGRLNELAFAPVDFSADAPVDEWSGDYGVGAMYFSQQATNYIACRMGIQFDEGMKLPERLVRVQELMAAGDASAEKLYREVGANLGHAVAWYREFYDFEKLLILGRVTTGRGGEIIQSTAMDVLAREYPELDGVAVAMPDEKAKRLGQAVAAASLV